MTEDIAAKIRERLEQPSSIPLRGRALRSVVDVCESGARIADLSAVGVFAADLLTLIAESLAISVSPLQGPNNPHPVSGSQPCSGDQASGGSA